MILVSIAWIQPLLALGGNREENWPAVVEIHSPKFKDLNQAHAATFGEIVEQIEESLPAVVAYLVEQRTRDSMFKGLNWAVAGICRK